MDAGWASAKRKVAVHQHVQQALLRDTPPTLRAGVRQVTGDSASAQQAETWPPRQDEAVKEDRVYVDSDGEVLIRVATKTATFGLVARHGRIVRTAPTAKWTVGKPVDEIIAHFEQRRATVETLWAIGLSLIIEWAMLYLHMSGGVA